MRKIAFRGLIGRKRDTLLLWSVVALAFLFLTLSTTLITSLQATDAAQRISTYGTWQVMAADLSHAQGERLAEQGDTSAVLPLIPVSGFDFFAGDNDYYLSVYSPELVELGQLQLQEGRWPQARNEVVLEYARLSSLGLEVGDTVTVSCQVQLPMTPEFIQQRLDNYNAATQEQMESYREELLEIFRSGDWEYKVDSLRIRDTVYQPKVYINGRPDFLAPYGVFSYLYDLPALGIYDTYDVDNLTEEEFLEIVHVYLTRTRALLPESKRVETLLGYEDMSMRIRYEAVDPQGDDDMTLMYLYNYTVCGVIETYTDRWDSGMLDLPGGFVTQESYQLLMDGQRSVLDSYPGFQGQDFDVLVLMSGGEDTSARELWRSLLPLYNPIADATYPLTTYRQVPHFLEYVNVMIDGEIQQVRPTGTYYREVYDFQLADEENQKLIYVSADLCSGGEGMAIVEFGRPTPVLKSYNGYTVVAEPIAVFDLGGEEWYYVPMGDFLAGNFTIEGMSPASKHHLFPSMVDKQDDFTTLRVNRFSYPSSAESGENLLVLVMGILFVTTVCAVCQICFTQIRRRLRRIVLLKSVGAETGQIARMLGWEFIYIWSAALVVGTALGLGGAWAATEALSQSRGKDVLLTIQPTVLTAALLAGTAALALGMCVPMVMAVGVPLTGRAVRKKPLPPPKKETVQDFFHVTLRGYATKKGRMVGSFALCAFMMTILVLCLFLGFRFLGEYRETVERDNKPDYLLRAPFAMSIRQRGEYLQELEELGICGEIQSYFVGEDIIRLHRSAWEDSPLVTAAAGDTEDSQAESYPVNLYGIRSSDALFADYSAAATVGSLNAEAFDAGEQVLLMIPLYRDTGKANGEALAAASGWGRLAVSGIDTSYYKEYDGIYSRDTAVQVGDTLEMGTTTYTFTEEDYSAGTQNARVTVGAILYYFPEEGIWPVSGSREGYQIVTSLSLIKQLIPQAGLTRGLSAIRAARVQAKTMSSIDKSYGFTDFYLNAGEGLDLDEVDTTLLIYARNHYMDIEVYHESSEKILQDALNNVLLVCLLGLTAVLLALMIFFNTVTSDLEQERSRLGILQSLGVSNRQLILRQLCLGLVSSAFALGIANLLLWGGVVLYAAVSGKVLGNLLWGYPVMGHVLLCLVVAILLTLLYVLPMVGLGKYLPIDNIRSRK